VKKSATARALFALCRVVGDTCASEEGMAAIVGRDKSFMSAAETRVSITQANYAIQRNDMWELREELSNG